MPCMGRQRSYAYLSEGGRASGRDDAMRRPQRRAPRGRGACARHPPAPAGGAPPARATRRPPAGEGGGHSRTVRMQYRALDGCPGAASEPARAPTARAAAERRRPRAPRSAAAPPLDLEQAEARDDAKSQPDICS